MSVKTTLILGVLLVLGLGACKKDHNEKTDTKLTGSWMELELSGVTRRITFNSDKSFNLLIGYPVAGGSMVKGSYVTKGANLKIQVEEIVEDLPGQPTKVSGASSVLYDKATYIIKGDTLILNYTSYPADAPEATTAKFKRAINID